LSLARCCGRGRRRSQSPSGHALIDRELYVPKSWISDPGRCAAAGIPQETVFATKPKLARIMIARTLDAGALASWVAGDEVYGADPGLRGDLERRRIGYVLARTHQVPTGASRGQKWSFCALGQGESAINREAPNRR
jgi:SRSO17 transposase